MTHWKGIRWEYPMYDTLHIFTRIDFPHLKCRAIKTPQRNRAYRYDNFVRSEMFRKSER
jgi:hypothetical protein